ncbi:STAS domain-containing protein [Prosthecochloris sp. SCSIO W1101]|uniref:STAS domain-containing protein n=1 Tax=Prosthecochloris sp. SCSIO W1101 TaxID=2992242 RepID=UPI00223D7214|nr:STAS domain-containing protein [Prosthecochloris sp. SCSIO W1101]UZJ40272.1 STAS domain-containing protein [Prosthecochloris sp. SCSIO W1101]
MKHSVSKRKDLIILKIEETVFDVRHARAFGQSIDKVLESKGKKNMIIDFSFVKAIDSCGISSMLLAHRKANQSEGLAIFVSLCQQIKDLLKLSGLDKQLFIFTSLNEVMTLIDSSGKGKKSPKKTTRTKAPALPVKSEECDMELISSSGFNNEEEIMEKPVKIEEKTSQQAIPSPKRGRPKKHLPPSIRNQE